MAVEFPVILSHNINREGAEHLAWTSAADDHETTRTNDGLRFTTWKATDTSTQNLTIRQPNSLTNGGWENSSDGWEVETTGTATVNYTRSTTEQQEGSASAEVDVTSYTSGDIFLNHRKTFNLTANRLYAFSIAWKNDNASADTFKIQILDSAGAVLATASDVAVGIIFRGKSLSFTPTTDEDDVTVQVQFPNLVRTNNLDVACFGELRLVDTIIIDQGHTLKDSDVTIQHRLTPLASFIDSSASASVTTSGVYFRIFTGVAAFDWRIKIENAVIIPEIPLLNLGKRVTLSHNPVSFDPTSESTRTTVTTTEAGVARDFFNFKMRTVSAQFENIGPTTEFQEWEDWFADIDGGRHAFWWIFRPTARPSERLFLRLTDKTFSFPFDRFSRSGGFEAEEVKGQLESA